MVKKKKGTPIKMDVFRLTWEKIGIVVLLWFAFVVLHNLISALFGFEEALFFILAVIVLPLYFLVSVIYTAYKLGFRKLFLKKRKGDYVWMAVFLVAAVGLAMVGIIRVEISWYIRALIFGLAALFLWWRNQK